MEARSTATDLVAAMNHHRAGRLRQAADGYRRILTAEPRSADAWHLLGVIATQEGRLREAVASIERALELAGPQPGVLFNLALALSQSGDAAGALARLAEVVKLAPRFAAAHRALAGLAAKSGQLDLAIAHWQRLVDLESADWEAHNNLGSLLAESDQWPAAAAAFQRACALRPPAAEPYFNLATALRRRRELDGALAACRRALELAPELPAALQLWGDLHADVDQTATAVSAYRRVAQALPRDLAAALRVELAAPLVFASNEHIDAWRETLAERLPQYLDDRWQLDLDSLAASGAKPPLCWIYQGRDDQPLKRLLAQIFARHIAPRDPRPRRGDYRVGFIVTPGNERIFARGMAGVLARLPARGLRTIIACGPGGRQALAPLVANRAVEYCVLPRTLPAAAAAIAELGLDLAYFWEIGTDSLNYFLPFFRLAPVQCTSWGWPVTSGIGAVDEFVSSGLLESAAGDAHYSERLVRLGRLPHCYTSPPPTAPVERGRWNLFPGDHCYLCPQNPRKLHPDFDHLAAAILRRDVRGVLVLIEATRPAVTAALRRRLAGLLPDCIDRVRFVPRMVQADYRALLASADVVLDSVHYGGGANSTLDALAADAPLVTLPGQFHRGRYALATYRLLGLEELAARDAADYVDRAVRLAGDADYRREWVGRVAGRRECLFDDELAVQELVEYFIGAIERSRKYGSEPSA